jgi:hypothetical protein
LISLKVEFGDSHKVMHVIAEPPKEGADRLTGAAEELAGSPGDYSFGAPRGPCCNPGAARPRQQFGGNMLVLKQEALMSITLDADNLESAIRHALLTTRATAACPFHPDVTIRVGDDAAETHAFYRARNVVKSDGTGWDHALLMKEIERQLDEAADRVCPQCSGQPQF